MPPKKKKVDGKKGGKKIGKKAAKAAADKEEAMKKCRNFLKTYQQHCSLPGRVSSQAVVALMREGIENEKPPVKFILDASASLSGASLMAKMKQDKSIAAVLAAHPQETKPTTAAGSVSPQPPPTKMVLQPLTRTWVEARYSFVRCLHVWSLELDDDAIVSLAQYFESPLGSYMKVLEMREVKISSWAINRLARSLHRAKLTVLNLDYNSILLSDLVKLCEGLQTCPTIQCISLNYCQLSPCCGQALGTYLATSGVRELSVVGNSLACTGCAELVRPLVAICDASQAILSAQQTPQHDTLDSSKTLTDGPGEVKTEPDKDERVLLCPPPLAKLFLQDNCIDVHAIPDGCMESGSFETVVCARLLKRLLMSSPLLEEVNLDGNLIGDGGGREVMVGMQLRKENGLPPLRMTVSLNISPEIYATIVELSMSDSTKKKGKKKGKKKKKG